MKGNELHWMKKRPKKQKGGYSATQQIAAGQLIWAISFTNTNECLILMIIERPYIIHNREWSIKHALKFSPQIWSARPQDSQTQVTPSQLPISITKNQIKEKYSNSITIRWPLLSFWSSRRRLLFQKARPRSWGDRQLLLWPVRHWPHLPQCQWDGSLAGNSLTAVPCWRLWRTRYTLTLIYKETKSYSRIFKLIKDFYWIFN